MEVFENAGIRCVGGPPVIDLGDGLTQSRVDECLSFIKDTNLKEHPLWQPAIPVHSVYTVGKLWHEQLVNANKNMNVVYHTHLHETEKECRDVERSNGGLTAIEILESIGALNSRFIAAHCVWLNDEEIGKMKKYDINVCHCPKANLKLASGFCPVSRLISNGVNVCLGTDSAASNNSIDMLAELQTAALLAKGVSKDPTVVDDYTALRMATRNGARALGRLDDLGSLEIGKLADIVAVDFGVECFPVHDPISSLVYTTGRRVTDVWVAGQRVVKQTVVQTVQPDRTKIEAFTAEVALWTKAKSL